MWNGIIAVNKEKGYTSHDVVAKLRGILKQKKIGHTGTLDPDAEGVLPVCLGSGTKLCDLLTDTDKTYEAVLRLGLATDTQDISGAPLYEKPVSVTGEAVCETVFSFLGAYDQIPPMYSALKVGGKKLYELAREGKTIERRPRRVWIRDIKILSLNLPENRIRLRVSCSKGTYIRTLCADIGEKLGCGGCMEALVRTRAGRFTLEESLRLNEIERLVREGAFLSAVVPAEEMFPDYPKIYADARAEKLLYNGNPLRPEGTGGFSDGDPVRMYDTAGRFTGIYKWNGEKELLWPVKLFFDRQDG